MPAVEWSSTNQDLVEVYSSDDLTNKLIILVFARYGSFLTGPRTVLLKIPPCTGPSFLQPEEYIWINTCAIL
jgi:hypothetical protein